MPTTYLVNLAAAFIPLLVGFVWYHPKIFGSVIKTANGVADSDRNEGHALWVYPLAYICGYYIAGALGAIVIHQKGLVGMLANQPDLHVAGTTLNTTAQGLLDTYGENFRTFKHGALHGSLTGLYLVFPVLAIITLFEKRRWTWLAIHAAYWIVCLALMGGVVCAYMPTHVQLAK